MKRVALVVAAAVVALGVGYAWAQVAGPSSHRFYACVRDGRIQGDIYVDRRPGCRSNQQRVSWTGSPPALQERTYHGRIVDPDASPDPVDLFTVPGVGRFFATCNASDRSGQVWLENTTDGDLLVTKVTGQQLAETVAAGQTRVLSGDHFDIGPVANGTRVLTVSVTAIRIPTFPEPGQGGNETCIAAATAESGPNLVDG